MTCVSCARPSPTRDKQTYWEQYPRQVHVLNWVHMRRVHCIDVHCTLCRCLLKRTNYFSRGIDVSRDSKHNRGYDYLSYNITNTNSALGGNLNCTPMVRNWQQAQNSPSVARLVDRRPHRNNYISKNIIVYGGRCHGQCDRTDFTTTSWEQLNSAACTCIRHKARLILANILTAGPDATLTALPQNIKTTQNEKINK